MNRPAPSLAILAAAAVILALIFFGRQYLWHPHRSAGAMARAAVAGYNRPHPADAPDQDDAATIAGMMDAGRLWAKEHRPNSAAGCPSYPDSFHAGCVSVVATGH